MSEQNLEFSGCPARERNLALKAKSPILEPRINIQRPFFEDAPSERSEQGRVTKCSRNGRARRHGGRQPI